MSATQTQHTPLATNEIAVTRLIHCPREMVYEVWTKPEHIKNWWGPNGFTNTISKMDFSPAGLWEFIMHGPDGKDYPTTWQFEEIIPNERIVLQHVVPPLFKMTATFEAQGNNTLLTIRNVFESTEVLEMAIKMAKADEGLKQNVDRLENYVQDQEENDHLVITRTFDAPRELVWKAFTERKRFAQWWGPKGFKINIAAFDMKPGGTLHYVMQAPNGMEMWGKFFYREIAEPEHMVFVNCFSDKEGNIAPNPYLPVWPLEIKNTLTLTETDGKTNLMLKGGPINASFAERTAFKNMQGMMQQGFKGTFEQLEQYLAGDTEQLPIVVERTFHAPIAKVWKAITDKDEIKKWSFDIAAFEPVVGYEFTFLGGKTQQYVHLSKVMEVIPERKLSYTWRYEGYEGDSLVTIELFPDGNDTRLKLTHTGLETLPILNPDFAVRNFIAGWTHIVHTSLKEYLEG